MKKLVTGCFGTIYYATILKNGLMSDKDRVNVTDDAIDAVFQHLFKMKNFDKEGFAGYDIPQKNSDNKVRLCIYDKSKYKLVPIESEEE